MAQKRVVIIDDGNWGDMEKEDYDSFTAAIKDILSTATKERSGSDELEKLASSVEVVKDLKEIFEKITDVDVVIFRTRDMTEEARKLKKRFSHLMVIVLTGLIPEDEIIFFDKTWLGVVGAFEKVVFS